MGRFLAVPVVLDALVLENDRTVVGPFADFTRLPYNDGTRDVSGDTPFVAASVLAPPFLDSALPLKAGIHLHWAMPDALTAGVHTDQGSTFPELPNRWLVVRSRRTGADSATVEARWVVESDYLYPDGTADHVADAVSVPAPSTAGTPLSSSNRPFRRQGRRIPWEGWRPDATAEYAPSLTAVGYGEPSFAAFYPSCRSIFGLLDDEYGPSTAGLQYDVFGWYSDAVDDPVATVLAKLASADPDAIAAALHDQLSWDVADADRPGLVDGTGSLSMVAYGRVRFPTPVAPLTPPAALTGAAPTVAVGNTGVEALAAHLATGLTPTPEEKARLEDQLVALAMSSRLADRTLDVGAAFRQARHERGFVAVPGGTLWTIGPDRSDATGRLDAVSGAELEQVTLPIELASALDALNRIQDDYDRAGRELRGRSTQLLADWTKYLTCGYPPEGGRDDYPDVDEVRHFLRTRGVEPLLDLAGAAGLLEVAVDAAGRTTGARSVGSADPEPGAVAVTLADQLVGAIDDLLRQLAAFNAASSGVAAAQAPYSLRALPGPRFWQPREPVVLVSGPAARPTPRHGQDGLLPCRVVDLPQDVVGDGGLSLVSWLEAAPTDDPGVREWSGQPWNPILLEWMVEVFPSTHGGDLDPATATYAPDTLSAGYSLPLDEPDLSPVGANTVRIAATEYSGRCVLTPSAPAQLAASLTDYLDGPGAPGTDPTGPDPTSPDPTSPDPTSTDGLRAALARLTDPDFSCLTQALGGFNEALLMRRQELQVPVDDPLGFAADRSFAADVRKAIAAGSGPGSGPASGPQPLTDFLPLRAGALRLLQLRLLDTFGQVRDVDLTAVEVPETLARLGDTNLVGLPPRFAQPSRVNLRFLAAAPDALGHDEVETNDHPATSPICGWILPNNLDGSLAVFDAAGGQLGLLDEAGRWGPLPGAPELSVAEIVDPTLRALVAYLLDRGGDFLAGFLGCVESALESIDPDTAGQHLDLALLVGRPLALIRVALDAELLGPAAISQSWNALRTDLRRTRRDDAGVPGVALPLRLGEFGRLRDGLAGFWAEQPGVRGPAGDFIAPQSTTSGTAGIRTAADSPAPLRRTFGQDPATLCLLVDPRAAVHVTSGIVPVKDIRLPPEQYTTALGAMSVSFLTTPVLTPTGVLDLPTPREPGFRWEWLAAGSAPASVSFDPASVFPGTQEIREGWLRLVPDPTVSDPSPTDAEPR